MTRRFAAALLALGLIAALGYWTVGRASERRENGRRSVEHGDRDRSDFALFDGTNPANEAPPNGGAECYVRSSFWRPTAATLHVTVTAHASGPAGFVRATFKDGDFVEFPIASGGSFNFTQSIGGSPGTDDRIRISNGGKTEAQGGARLVGWASLESDGAVHCQSCDFDDAEGGTGCQNHP
jgi:hypothetical protein